MGRSVRVTADDGHTWKRKTLLWSDYVDDTIVLSVHGKVSYAEISSVLCQGIYLLLRDRILEAYPDRVLEYCGQAYRKSGLDGTS